MKRNVVLLLSLIFVMASTALAQTAKKTILNADLEKYRQKRVQSEADYRSNYKRLGLPSPEELEQRAAERNAQLEEYSKKIAAENQQSENYFEEQANQLKTEIVSVQAQINYLRVQINNLPNQSSLSLSTGQVYAVGVVPGVVFGGGGYYRGNRGGFGTQTNAVNVQAPNAQVAINAAAGMPNPYSGTALSQTGVKVTIGATNGYYGRGGYRYNRPYYGGGYILPTIINNNSYERDDLVSRLRYLEQVKAGLFARFEFLQDEARRAGIRID